MDNNGTTGGRKVFRRKANRALILAASALNRAGDMLRAGGLHTRISLPGADEIPLCEACYNLANAIIGVFEEGGQL